MHYNVQAFALDERKLHLWRVQTHGEKNRHMHKLC